MTLLEQWDHYGGPGILGDHAIRRALAIAQKAQHYADAGSTEARQIVREADELLEGR